MKRSEVNEIMKEAVAFAEKFHFKLPPFALWGKEDWLKAGKEYDEIRDCMLGWDITDFGSGDFKKVGLLMFTIRNGCYNSSKYDKVYAEKLLISRDAQVTPYHFHWKKMEDIINRGGGNLMVSLYNQDEEGKLDKVNDVKISMDGRNYMAPAGTVVKLTPGESITLPPGQYHSFWGEKGYGTVLIGEVSKVNNDNLDNNFLEIAGRFPEIEEDVEPLYLLYTDY